MDKVKVIYTVWYWHSGSSLINAILWWANDSIAVSELIKLWHRIRKLWNSKILSNRWKCQWCRENIYNCKLWSQVLKEVPKDNIYFQNENFLDNLKISLNILFWFPKINFNNLDDTKLYNSIIKNSNKIYDKNINTVVDSSKDPRRLKYLQKNPNIDLYVIYLTRDLRWVSNSMEKRWKNFWRTYIIWHIWNILSYITYKKHNKNKKIMISYDKFTQNPDKYLKRIKDKFNIDLNMEDYLDNANKQEIHYIWWNSMQKKDITEIKYDQSWKKRMPKWKQFILNMICYIPNKIWVYNKKL